VPKRNKSKKNLQEQVLSAERLARVKYREVFHPKALGVIAASQTKISFLDAGKNSLRSNTFLHLSKK